MPPKRAGDDIRRGGRDHAYPSGAENVLCPETRHGSKFLHPILSLLRATTVKKRLKRGDHFRREAG